MHQEIKSRRDKLKLLKFIQDQPKPQLKYFNIARKLIDDPDPTTKVRWQALIAIGSYIESHPAKVWDVIKKYGSSHKQDMRAGVGCVLLEHLLDYQFDIYFPKCKKLVESGDKKFLRTLGYCAVMAKRYEKIVRKYVKEVEYG